jgi:hypothetical protein
MQIEESNIFAVGCSFTWGESLQFFSGLDSVVWKEKRPSFPDAEKTLDEAQLNFIKENRYPALLSKKLGVDYVTQSKNGGTNNESLLKAQYFYANEENRKNYKHFVIQVTHFSRDPIIFKLPNGEIIPISDITSIRKEFDLFEMDDSKILYDSYLYFYDKLYDFIKTLNDVNVYIICYPYDSVDTLLSHPLNQYLVKLNYKGMMYTSTSHLVKDNPLLEIQHYFAKQNFNKGDNHLTLEGHKIISDSIYSRILLNKNL